MSCTEGEMQGEISEKRKSSFKDSKLYQNQIPGYILILLDPHKLYVCQNLPFLDKKWLLAKEMAMS